MFGIKNIQVFQTNQALSNYVRKEGKEGVFLDVGANTTNVLIIKKDEPIYLKEVPVGGDSFNQVLEREFGMQENTARELKESYAKKELSDELRKKLRALFAEQAEQWGSELRKALSETPFALPGSWYLLGGGSKLPEIKEAIEKEIFPLFPFVDSPIFLPLISQEKDVFLDSSYSLLFFLL